MKYVSFCIRISCIRTHIRYTSSRYFVYSKEPEVPNKIECEDLVTTLACHPFQDLVAAGFIDGNIHL